MQQAYVVTGSLADGRTVTLDEPLPVAAGKVRVVVEVLPGEAKPRMRLEEFEKVLRERQAARGHVPRTKEEVDAYLKAERESWDF